jgi:biopolymer transport protein ExbD
MAIKLGHDGDDFAETHEINVTPFIDVNLPSTNAQRQDRPEKPVFLTIKADRSLAIGEEPVPREGLRQALETASKGNRNDHIFVRADKAVSYGDVMQVMNDLRAAGFLKVALVALETSEGK